MKSDYSFNFVAQALLQECHHVRPSLIKATTYCFCVSAAFVGALYVLVPAKVRRLDRDDPLQIKWRTFATGSVCMSAIVAYSYTFCIPNHSNSSNDYYETTIDGTDPVLVRTGFAVRPVWNLFGTLFHSMILYIGPIAVILMQAKLMAQASQQPRTSSSSPSPTTSAATQDTPVPISVYLEALQAVLFPPRIVPLSERQQEVERWISLRSKVIAPIFEEIVFRGCMVPALVATQQIHPWAVAWLAPVFFGLAHCHHAALKIHQGEQLSRVIISTVFQFLYTSLFGAYAAHAFLRSRSIVAVCLAHSFCNTMGLPSLYFFNNKDTPLYQYRMVLLKAHLIGVVLFALGFPTDTFLPLPNNS